MDKVMYCRGCNREFILQYKYGESFVEKIENDEYLHPIADCDEVKE